MLQEVHCIFSPRILLNRKTLFVYSDNHMKSINMWAKYRVLDLLGLKRLRWSRGSVVAFGTHVRGFEPGRSRQIFLARLPSDGEVNPSVPCRRFAACKRPLKKAWKSLLSAKFVCNFSPSSSTSRCWDL